MQKKCEFCGKSFPKPYSCSKRSWVKTRFCSKKCHYDLKKGKPIPWLLKATTGKTGKKSWNWKAGKITRHGYIGVHKDNLTAREQKLFSSMFQKWWFSRYLYEHRLVVARVLGRPLTSFEQVHHINGNKSDNKLSNLYLFSSNGAHRKYEGLKNKPKLKSNLIS